MLKKLFSVLQSKKKAKPSASVKQAKATNGQEIPEKPPFTRWLTFGNHLYRHGEPCDVVFVDESDGTHKTIVDNSGRILNFPGIEVGTWMESLTGSGLPEPIVCFRTEFHTYDETHYIMIWEIQPDGMYWMDEDGYGMTGDEEIRLYALIDRHGDFTGPFRIYSVGSKNFLGITL